MEDIQLLGQMNSPIGLFFFISSLRILKYNMITEKYSVGTNYYIRNKIEKINEDLVKKVKRIGGDTYDFSGFDWIHI